MFTSNFEGTLHMPKPFLSVSLIVVFMSTAVIPISPCLSQPLLGLPEPGTMIHLSSAFQPAMIKGLTIHKDNPFLFDFIVDIGHDKLGGEALKQEGEKLIKYFLASLTIPEKDLWVNLSPYENDKIIPQALSQTDMGRDMLAQDYILKQLTASLIYPEKELGKNFWDKIHARTQQVYGSVQIPVNTFNKVWIMADKAEVFERGQTVFVTSSHLKVMLEEDYLALDKNHKKAKSLNRTTSSQVVREIILPEIENEVNTGKHFAQLRQIFNSIILATWYKTNLKAALLNHVYAGQSRVKGIDLEDRDIKAQIYERYLQAYKKGVFNYIREDATRAKDVAAPRKYFSGGLQVALRDVAVRHDDLAMTGVLKGVTGLVNLYTKFENKFTNLVAILNPYGRLRPENIDYLFNEAVSFGHHITSEDPHFHYGNLKDLLNILGSKRVFGSEDVTLLKRAWEINAYVLYLLGRENPRAVRSGPALLAFDQAERIESTIERVLRQRGVDSRDITVDSFDDFRFRSFKIESELREAFAPYVRFELRPSGSVHQYDVERANPRFYQAVVEKLDEIAGVDSSVYDELKIDARSMKAAFLVFLKTQRENIAEDRRILQSLAEPVKNPVIHLNTMYSEGTLQFSDDQDIVTIRTPGAREGNMDRILSYLNQLSSSKQVGTSMDFHFTKPGSQSYLLIELPKGVRLAFEDHDPIAAEIKILLDHERSRLSRVERQLREVLDVFDKAMGVPDWRVPRGPIDRLEGPDAIKEKRIADAKQEIQDSKIETRIASVVAEMKKSGRIYRDDSDWIFFDPTGRSLLSLSRYRMMGNKENSASLIRFRGSEGTFGLSADRLWGFFGLAFREDRGLAQQFLGALEQQLSDGAMSAEENQARTARPAGGIDLNTTDLGMSVRKEGTGVQMRIDPAMIERVKREGINSLTPVIYRMASLPVAGIWPLLKMQPLKK